MFTDIKTTWVVEGIGHGHEEADDVEGLKSADVNGKPASEVLTEEMGGSRLQGFAVLHHSFDAHGVHRPGKPFSFRFAPLDHRHGQVFFRHTCISITHLFGPFNGLFAGGMRSVPFLP